MTSISGLGTKSALTAVRNKTLDVSTLVKKTDYKLEPKHPEVRVLCLTYLKISELKLWALYFFLLYKFSYCVMLQVCFRTVIINKLHAFKKERDKCYYWYSQF